MTETGLDLGWCIVRPLSDYSQRRIRGVKAYPRIQAVLAEYAGLTRWQFKKLTADQRHDLWLAHLWMMRQFDAPMVGTVVNV